MKSINNFLALLAMSILMVACNNTATDSKDTTDKEDKKTETTAKTVAEEVKGYKIGDIATDFSLKNVDEQMVSLASMSEAKGYVIVFTCNHCPYSIAYEDRLNTLDQKYKALGYPVVAINPNDPAIAEDDGFVEMQARAKEKSFSFPYLFDDGQKVYPQYGATKTPHVYVLQKTEEGNKVVYIGAIDDSKDAEEVKEKYLENALDALVEGKMPDPATTKAFGCSVKTAKKM